MTRRVSGLSAEEFSRQMARREIVFRRPTPWWQDGLVIGNGDLGGAAYGGDAGAAGVISVAISKVDVWDERFDTTGYPRYHLDELRKLIAENAGTPEGRQKLNGLERPTGVTAKGNWIRETYPYAYAPPTPKPSGIVRVDPGAAAEPFEERLSLHRGEVTFRLGEQDRGRRVEVDSWVDAQSNVLVVRVARRGEFERPLSFQLARYVDEQLGEPEVGVEGSAFWHRYVFPDGFTYAVYGVVAGAAVQKTARGEADWHDVEARTTWVPTGGMRIFEAELTAPERWARLTLAADAGAATLYVGVATSKEAADPLARARELAQAAAARGYDALHKAHLAWWDAFWRRSSLVLSDRFVETVWYQGLYVLACQSRGNVPPSLVGPGYQLPHGGWHGLMHTDYNVQMFYWPTYTANHLELAQTYFGFFRRNLDLMKAETWELYGIDGCKFPGLTDGTCRERSWIPCRMWQCVSAWCAQLFWWGYQYSGDLEFLRETAYPVLREVAKFYRGYALRGEDGYYHMFPSTPPEQSPWWATDPAIDMSLIRVHLAATLEAAALLGVDDDLRPGWQDLLDHLAPIPTNGDVILDHSVAAVDSKLGHTALLNAVYTGGLIGLRSSPEQQALAWRTFQSLFTRTGRRVVDYPVNIPTWNDDCNWQSFIAYAARLGKAEEARKYVYDAGIFQHLKPNGLFAFDCPTTDEQRESRWGMPDSSHFFTAAVSEMLLQSYDGVIHVAPAVPADWDVSVSGFLTMGAFEVDADVVVGKVRSLALHSLKGNPCRVVNPWPAERVAVLSGGKPVPFSEANGILSFATVAGASYEIAAAGQAAARPFDVPSASPEPQSYAGPVYMGEIPPEQRWTVWLGLPAAD